MPRAPLSPWTSSTKALPGQLASDTANSLATGLVYCYLLTECGGPGTCNSARTGPAAPSNGTLTNGPKWSQGNYGPALTFVGGATNDVISFNDASIPTGGNPITIMARASTTHSGAANEANFVCRLGSSATAGHQIYLGQENHNDGHGSIFEVGVGGVSSNLQTLITINDGKWHHFGATYQGTTWTLYLDGNQVASGSTSVNKNTSLTGSSTISASSSNGWVGQIDHVMIWNRVLTGGEFQSLARNSNQFMQPFVPWATGLTFAPWIYGDQIEANAMG